MRFNQGIGRRRALPVAGERGQALVEFALVLTPLLLIIVAIVQFGFWFQARSALRDGVRAAARQASLCRSIPGFDDSTAYTAYHGIVDSSVANAINPTITWGPGPADNRPICIAGTPVAVTGSYDYPINILGLINVGGDQLTATAVGVVE
jgi:Flp pilus assembly protein TadG